MKIPKPLLFLIENILAGTRAALFMPVHLWSFKGGFGQVCLLLIVSFLLSLTYDYIDTLPDNYFNHHGLSYQAMLYLLFFFSLSLVAYLNERLKELDKLIILFLSVVPVIWLGTICLLELAKQQSFLDAYYSSWAVFFLYSTWYLLVAFRLIKRYFYLSIPLALAYVVLYMVINFLPLFLLPTQPLWHTIQTDNKQTKPVKNIDIESIYYDQNSLISETTDKVLDNRENIIDLFFIGFAGDAEEDVFMNEVLAARDILENRFDTFGRSAVLINNANTVKQYPLANQHNLRSMLNDAAAKMNLDDDILFLFLTSHGSKDHSIAVDFYPFKLNNLNPKTIKNLLDDAGIKWRIIVVSACYSGGFIEPLANPHTLIITAARADRNSFGCGHDGQFTYFGEAYFDQALKQTRSFIEAFELAKKIILEKEDKQGYTNSDPQINIGNEIESKLTLYNQQLEAKGYSNWAITNKANIEEEAIRQVY